jgi:hypothetical protein
MSTFKRRKPAPQGVLSISTRIAELVAVGASADDLLFAIARESPDVSLKDFCAGLALHRARPGAPAIRVPSGKLN